MKQLLKHVVHMCKDLLNSGPGHCLKIVLRVRVYVRKHVVYMCVCPCVFSNVYVFETHVVYTCVCSKTCCVYVHCFKQCCVYVSMFENMLCVCRYVFFEKSILFEQSLYILREVILKLHVCMCVVAICSVKSLYVSKRWCIVVVCACLFSKACCVYVDMLFFFEQPILFETSLYILREVILKGCLCYLYHVRRGCFCIASIVVCLFLSCRVCVSAFESFKCAMC